MAIDLLVVGLGNPGKQYARTRHNVGEETVGVLASRYSATLRAGRDDSLVAECSIAGRQVALAFPLTYMNDSGRAVQAVMRRFHLRDPQQLIVVHDELDLPPSVVRVKAGGGLAGNNGLRSITQHLHTQDFIRVRIGIGKPPSKERGAMHVLSKLSKAERAEMDVAVQLAADAVEIIIGEGVEAAQRRFNATTHDPPDPTLSPPTG
jgi:peptidyl-tRNA hydrolase, PTH1 family